MCKLCVRWKFEVMLHRWNASIAKRILSKVWLFVNTKWTLWSGHGRRRCFSKMLLVTATVPGFTFSTICCPRRRRKTFWINIFQEIFHVANFQEKICRKSCEISDQILFRQYCIAQFNRLGEEKKSCAEIEHKLTFMESKLQILNQLLIDNQETH